MTDSDVDDANYELAIIEHDIDDDVEVDIL